MEEIDWNIMGRSNVKKTFIIKLPKDKRWWEFWKKSRAQMAEESLKNIASRYKEEIIFPENPEAGAGLLKIPESFSKPFSLESYMRIHNIDNVSVPLSTENKKS